MRELQHIITIVSFADSLGEMDTVTTGCGLTVSNKVLFAKDNKSHNLNAERFLQSGVNRCPGCEEYATLYVLASLP